MTLQSGCCSHQVDNTVEVEKVPRKSLLVIIAFAAANEHFQFFFFSDI